MPNCDNCGNDKAWLKHDIYLCRDCSRSTCKDVLTKTDAMKKYMLTSKDLDRLRHGRVPNVYGGETKLYLTRDLERLAKQKHGDGGLELKREERRMKERERLFEKGGRQKELERHFASLGLDVDVTENQMCQDYIKYGGKSGLNPEKIGELISEAQFFKTKTKYFRFKRELDRELERDGMYRYTGEDYYREERAKNDKAAKEKAMKEYIRLHYNDTDFPKQIPNKYKGEAQLMAAHFQKMYM